MSFNQLVFFICCVLLSEMSMAEGSNKAKETTPFLLNELNESQYLLTTPAHPSLSIIVDLQGADEAELLTVYRIQCYGHRYDIPAIRSDIENREFVAEHIEYFILKTFNQGYVPLKSTSSIKSIERMSGMQTTRHRLISSQRDFSRQLCNAIKAQHEMDYPIQLHGV